VFPPREYAGIAVLRPPRKTSHAQLLATVQTLADAVAIEQLEGRLWIVEIGRLRVHEGAEQG
jgi:hypothetical protein